MGWIHEDGKGFRENGPGDDRPGWHEVSDEDYRLAEADAWEQLRIERAADAAARGAQSLADALVVYTEALTIGFSPAAALIQGRAVDPAFTAPEPDDD
jgi:hypothetical protein